MASVSELLGIDPSLEVEIYVLGSEPLRPLGPRGPRAARCDPMILAPYLEDARAGASDAAIAAETGTTLNQVRHWRCKHEIKRRPGRRSTWAKTTSLACELFGSPFASIVSAVEPGDGVQAFEPPEYLRRVALDYGALVRCVGCLVGAGIEVAEIAAGIGLRPRDVETAARLS